MIVFECSSACECSESDKDLKTTNSSSTTLPVKVSFYLFRQRNLNFLKSFNSEKNTSKAHVCVVRKLSLNVAEPALFFYVGQFPVIESDGVSAAARR